MKKYESTKVKERYAIMGGTFDPIHFGHLAAAEEVRQKLDCQKVIFIPTGNPPHKRERQLTNSSHRYAMTLLATESNPNFLVSDIEINRIGYSYTLDTIKGLRQAYADEVEFLFITGADALLEIETWYRVEELLKLCGFVAVTRPGYNKANLEQKLYQLKSKYDSELHIVDVPGLNISSTEIRSRIKKEMSIRYLVPEQVIRYIDEQGLYRSETMNE